MNKYNCAGSVGFKSLVLCRCNNIVIHVISYGDHGCEML